MEILPISKEEISKVEVFNPIGEIHWEREFFSVDRGASCLFACFDGDKTIGSEGYVGYPLIYKGQKTLTHRSERTLVDPNYRGQGIFEKLIQHCDEYALSQDSKFVWGATAALKPFVRAGFNSTVGFRTYVFYPVKMNLVKKLFFLLRHLVKISPFRIYQAMKKNNISLAKDLMAYVAAVKPIKRGAASLSLEPVTPTEIVDFSLKLNQEQYTLCIDDRLFHWLKEKGKSYVCYKAMMGTEMKGYVILREELNSFYVTVVDIYLEDCPISALLNALSRRKEYRDRSSFFIAFNAENAVHKNYIQDLQINGVLHKQKAGSFVIKPLKDSTVKIQHLMLTDLWLEL